MDRILVVLESLFAHPFSFPTDCYHNSNTQHADETARQHVGVSRYNFDKIDLSPAEKQTWLCHSNNNFCSTKHHTDYVTSRLSNKCDALERSQANLEKHVLEIEKIQDASNKVIIDGIQDTRVMIKGYHDGDNDLQSIVKRLSKKSVTLEHTLAKLEKHMHETEETQGASNKAILDAIQDTKDMIKRHHDNDRQCFDLDDSLDEAPGSECTDDYEERAMRESEEALDDMEMFLDKGSTRVPCCQQLWVCC